MMVVRVQEQCIGLATKWLRVLSLPPNGKTRSHLVANPIVESNVSSKVFGRIKIKSHGSMVKQIGFLISRIILKIWNTIKILKINTKNKKNNNKN